MRSVWPSFNSRAPVGVARGALSTRAPAGTRRPLRSRTAGSLRAEVLRRGRSRGLGVGIVVVPPPVGRGLRVALRRVLPLLLAAERGDVEVTPGRPQGLVTAGVDEVGTEDL